MNTVGYLGLGWSGFQGRTFSSDDNFDPDQKKADKNDGRTQIANRASLQPCITTEQFPAKSNNHIANLWISVHI